MRRKDMRERKKDDARIGRSRRVIALFDAEKYALLEATALLCGFPSADEYALEAIMDRVESDRRKIQAVMEKRKKKG
jgi:hypothetical protein